MPSGIYQHKPQQGFQKGHKVYGGFQKGYKPTEKTIKKMSIAHKGERHNNWKGGCKNYWQKRARQKVIDFGYSLMPNEVVHHIDNNKKNDKILNLIVFKNTSQHCRWHFLPTLLLKRQELILSP